MKFSNLLSIIFVFCCIVPSFSQKPLKVKKIGVELGVDRDMIKGMSGKTLLSRASTDIASYLPDDVSLNDEYQFSGVCENPNMRVTVVLEPTFFKNTEIQTAASVVWQRYDAVGYYNPDSWNGNYNYYDIETYGNEINLEAALVKSFGPKWIKFYGGAGANLGYHFGNELYVSGMNVETPTTEDRTFAEILTTDRNYEFYEDNGYYHYSEGMSNGTSTRVFAQAGVGIIFFKRVELGMTGRFGYGLRTYHGEKGNFTNLRSLGMTLKYVLK